MASRLESFFVRLTPFFLTKTRKVSGPLFSSDLKKDFSDLSPRKAVQREEMMRLESVDSSRDINIVQSSEVDAPTRSTVYNVK